MAMDGPIVARSQRGQRTIPSDRFFTGFCETVLAQDETVTEILISKQPAGSGTAFLKFLPATQDDYATVSVAARIALNGNATVAEARVALGGTAMPVRARAVEAVLPGKAANEKTFREAASLVLSAIVRRALAEASAKSRRPV